MKEVRDLFEALKNIDTVNVTNVAREILDMFHNEDQVEDQDRLRYRSIRFKVAQKLYNKVINGKIDRAFFYKIIDRDNFVSDYQEVRKELLTEFDEYFKNIPLNKENMRTFFRKDSGPAPASDNSSSHKQKKLEIRKKILNRMNLLLDSKLSEISNTQESRRWSDIIEEIAKNEFYDLSNAAQALEEGSIYNPWSDDNEENVHNWGINVAWTLAVTQKFVKIHLLSELNKDNGVRHRSIPGSGRYPYLINNEEQPSAFALEISIAISMGYVLDFTSTSRNKVILQPPSNHPEKDKTTEISGNSVIPTKEEQINIFNYCVNEKKKFEEARKEIYDTLCSIPNNEFPKTISDTILTFAYCPTQYKSKETNNNPVMVTITPGHSVDKKERRREKTRLL